jgi:hypothetical protein
METEVPTDIKLRGPYIRNSDHILDEFARLDLLIKAQVIAWQLSTACAGPERDWGMVVVSREEVDTYVNSAFEPPGSLTDELPAPIKPWWHEAAQLRVAIDRLCDFVVATDLRLVRLARCFSLNHAEKDILLLCLLPEVDERYRRLFSYLQNDASRQTLSVELVSEILRGTSLGLGMARDLFSAFGNLVANHLIVLGNSAAGEDSLARRSVQIDDRIASYLLGSDEPDARLAGILETSYVGAKQPIQVRPETLAFLECLPESLRVRLKEKNESVRLLLLGKDARLAAKVSRGLCRALRIPALEFEVPAALCSRHSWDMLVNTAYREAQLARAALFFQGCGPLLGAEVDPQKWDYLAAAALRFRGLTIVDADSSAVASGAISDADFWQIDLPLPDYDTRKVIWQAHLPTPAILALSEDERTSLAGDLAGVFQITEAQIEDAVAGAANLARRHEQIEPSEIFAACRRLSGKKLVTFAQRIEPRRGLSIDSLVLPESNKRQLSDLRNRIHHHRELFQRTGFEQTMRLGKGLLALFAGGSGTGKTLAAEALASGQGVDLYKVDLSAVTSKWVGETEKNLSRVFADAESSSGCGWLFFDEGESLFGSRGDIKQAQDRLLNMEVNYLLQRIEEFSGVVILATNLRQNIDDAFLRRIHALVEFPPPNAQSRAAIWNQLAPGPGARDFDDQQLADLAARFELSGGNIRNIVLDAMFRACATEEKRLTLRHVAASIAREYQKLGRPITGAEFGNEFYEWIVEDILDPSTGERAT